MSLFLFWRMKANRQNKVPVLCPSSIYSEFKLLVKLRIVIIQESTLSVESVLKRQETRLLLVLRCWRCWFSTSPTAQHTASRAGPDLLPESPGTTVPEEGNSTKAYPCWPRELQLTFCSNFNCLLCLKAPFPRLLM